MNSDAGAWFASAITTPVFISFWKQLIAAALSVPEVAEKLRSQGVEVAGTDPAQFRTFVQQQIDMWGKVIKDNNIKGGD